MTLAEYLAARGICAKRAAAAIGCSVVAVWFWRHERRRPSTHYRRRIQVWSGGQVNQFRLAPPDRRREGREAGLTDGHAHARRGVA